MAITIDTQQSVRRRLRPPSPKNLKVKDGRKEAHIMVQSDDSSTSSSVSMIEEEESHVYRNTVGVN